MKTFTVHFIRLLFGIALFAPAGFHPALLWAQPPQYVGELKPIWRTQPVIGRWLSSGQGLIRPPAYLFDTSFPYNKRPYEKEVLFADHLIVVRLLGGWNTDKLRGELNGSKAADLIYRDNDGKIGYRWNLLFDRLDPYISNGYTDLTLVLDNIPWDLPASPVMGKYGQTAPPADMLVWQEFMQTLATQLVDKYGENIAAKFRFRLGTECDDLKRFSGDQEQYTQMYVATLKGIRKVLPDSQIGPCNHAGGKSKTARNNIDFSTFYSDVALLMGTGENIVNFFPVSTYYIQRIQGGNLEYSRLRKTRNINDRFWKKISADAPVDEMPSREIHETGLLVHSSVGSKAELGVRGAVRYLKTLIDMYQIGVSRVAHWRTLDKVGGNPLQLVLSGRGWVLSILEHLAGGNLYVYDDEQIGDVSVIRYLLVKEDVSYLIVSTFGDDLSVHSLSTDVPTYLLHQHDKYSFSEVSLTLNNSICSIIKADLAEARALKPGFAGELSPCIELDKMMTPSGSSVFSQNWDRYQKLIVESLTLKDTSNMVTQVDNQLRYNLNMPVPAVHVLQMR